MCGLVRRSQQQNGYWFYNTGGIDANMEYCFYVSGKTGNNAHRLSVNGREV